MHDIAGSVCDRGAVSTHKGELEEGTQSHLWEIDGLVRDDIVASLSARADKLDRVFEQAGEGDGPRGGEGREASGGGCALAR